MKAPTIKSITYVARSKIQRSELAKLLEQQLSYVQIAKQLNVSVSTVQRALKLHGLSRPKGLHYDKNAPKHIDRECAKHGLVRHRLEAAGNKRWYRCGLCSNEAARRRRARIKETLVAEFGGACQGCGYNRCLSVLQFHHRDPSNKVMQVSKIKSLNGARVEAAKCDLLCSNCHDEITYGFNLGRFHEASGYAEPAIPDSVAPEELGLAVG